MQTQTIVGERNISVQIDESNNTVTLFAGAIHLLLDQRHKLRAPPISERELLLTELRATDLVGREGDLTRLRAWLESPGPISVRCLTGRAGAGKTRLGIELCERAESDGWVAGFARHEELLRFGRSLSAWRWAEPTLVVVDAAAASTRILRVWLEALVRRARRPDEPPLRLLLLERHADRELGWWAELARPGDLSGRGPDALMDPAEPVTLPSLRSVEDRRALLAQVMREAARLRGINPAPKAPPPGADLDFDRRLADDLIDNEPLYLAMAGMVGVATGAPAALALTRTDLAERVAAAEADRLARMANHWGSTRGSRLA